MSLVAGSYERFIWGFKLKTLKHSQETLTLTPLFSFPSHLHPIRSVAVAGSVAASGSEDDTIKIYDLSTSAEIGSLIDHSATVTSLSFFTPPSISFPRNLISASYDGAVCVYDADPFVHLKTIRAHKKCVNDIAVHPSGKLALTVGGDSCLAMLNLVRGRRSFYCRLGKEASVVKFDYGGDKFFMVMDKKVSVHEVNPKGLEYYNNLINELVKNGIQPYATLTHSDIPQSLEDEYEGWVSRKIVRDFTAYANVCFREFGDRVLHWTTVNEPNVFAMGGYDDGWTPPQRCSPPFGMTNCSRGDSSTEPYVAAHNILLAHASAARLYRKKYQERQHGYIGINIYSSQLVPYTNATKDLIATERARSFLFGWIVEPLLFGDYPEIMKMIAGTRIPAFTKSESKQVKGSIDFLGLNHYFTLYVKDRSSSLEKNNRDYHADMAAQTIYVQGDTPSGEYPITPSGLAGTLEYYKQFYGNLPIYIHENGQKTRRNSTLNDTARVEYLHVFIGSVLDALRNGSNVRGYFQWSFMDLYELLDGYRVSFGLYYVDLDDKDLKRHPKLSSHWYSNFLKGKISSLDAIVEVKKNISSLSQPQLISDA